MTEKNRYEKPDCEIIEFKCEDVMTLSGMNNDANQGEWDPAPSLLTMLNY